MLTGSALRTSVRATARTFRILTGAKRAQAFCPRCGSPIYAAPADAVIACSSSVLGCIALAFTAASSKADQAAIASVLARQQRGSQRGSTVSGFGARCDKLARDYFSPYA